MGAGESRVGDGEVVVLWWEAVRGSEKNTGTDVRCSPGVSVVIRKGGTLSYSE